LPPADDSRGRQLLRKPTLGMKELALWTKIYIAATVAIGLVLLATALPQWSSAQSLRFVLYMAAALLASNFKVIIPGITCTVSPTFLAVLISAIDLSLPQMLAVAYVGTTGQFVLRSKRRKPIQLVFNLGSATISAFACFQVYHSAWLREARVGIPILLVCASAVLFLVNSVSVSGIIALTEKKNVWRVWHEGFSWTVIHHLAGAGLVSAFHWEEVRLGWEASLLTVPVVYFVYWSCALYVGRLEAANAHASEIADLHWRTIEALALAIDAKDETTHNHLLRVKIYAVEIGKELGLTEPEMQALQAAALLHDIGKLAVPEYIISKPGKLTHEEFQKMKVHPLVGAEILERARFPYPVAAIVRAHHEKWNGEGYPAGLRGEEIPIGARILAAVDCLDALASNRQYRSALPPDEAMARVVAESGTSFDPRVVQILKRRYIELESIATSSPGHIEPRLSTNVKIARGEGPGAGYEEMREDANSAFPIGFMVSIAGARREFRSLVGIIEDLGSSLSVAETLSLLAVRLKRLVPHDMAAIFVRQGEKLLPTYASGADARLFTCAEMVVGEGLTGWVVKNRKPIVNGNPSVEPGYPGPNHGGSLRSAISVPLEAGGEVIGALTLYSMDVNAFNHDHLRILLGISPKAGLTLANSLEHQRTADLAAMDDLTGLPNAKSLLLHLEAELKLAAEEQSTVAVLLIDLDGFKQVNDRFGHLTGNRVLQKVSAGLRESCRETDYVARIGGDEFVVVIRGIAPEDLGLRVRGLSIAVAIAGADECGCEILGMSVGEAFYPGDSLDAEGLMVQADSRMYGMKRGHRASDEAFVRSAPVGVTVH
jgi:diguanylate cyclase (GGDEF)-like protein/putative nucleotidyltransferase with HDIG domain